MGIAEVQGQLQLFVIDQGSHSLSLGDVLVRVEVLHAEQLAGEGGTDGEVIGVLQQGLHILVQAVQLLLSGGDLVLGALAVNGVEGLSSGDGVSGGHKDLTHGASGGQGDRGVLLCFGVAAAGGLALDRAVVGHHSLHLCPGGVVLGQKAVQEVAAHRQRGGGDGCDGDAAHLLFAGGLLGLSRGGRRGCGVAGLGESGVWHKSILL